MKIKKQGVNKMSRKLNEFDLKCLAYGAAFLGSGGGGKLDAGLIILERMAREEGNKFVELMDVSKMGNGYAVPVSLIGSAAEAEDDEDFRGIIRRAGETMRDNLANDKKNLECIISGELGGENTIVSAYAAASLGIPMIDADCSGRAVPELGTSLFTINKIGVSPLVMAAGEGESVDTMITYPADPYNNDVMEKLARSICVAYGGTAAMSTWPVNREDIENKLLPGEISKSIAVGKLILNAQEKGLNIVDQILSNIDCREIATGTIKKVDLEVNGGFEIGTVTVADPAGDYKIYFKNESLMARNPQGEIIVAAPDLISMIDMKSYRPLTNADLEVGMEVVYFSINAQSQWKKSKEALSVWEPILEVMRRAT
jgi:hypothetical protein